MRKIVMISHGKLAEGLKDTLNLFIGENHDFISISAYSEDVVPDVELEKVLDGVSESDQLIILTDILGGSVNQMVLPYLTRKNTYILTGLNLPMAIGISVLPMEADIDDFRRIIEETKESIILMNDYKMPEFDEDDE